MNRLLLLLIAMGLLAGCAAGAPTSPGVELPSASPFLSRQTKDTRNTPTAAPKPTIKSATAVPPRDLLAEPGAESPRPGLFPGNPVPPAVEEHLTPTPDEMARLDLARRLNADLGLIQLVSVVVREPNVEDMACLAENSYSEELCQVRRITLAVKGNVYQYVAWGERVIYCGR